MPVNYQIQLKNHDGDLQAVIVDFQKLDLNHVSSGIGSAKLTIDGNDPNRPYFIEDAIIEIWRSNKEAGIDWYIEWEGLCRTNTISFDEEGQSYFDVVAQSYLSLIKRRIIAYFSNTSFTSKSGPGEKVIKEFVSENCTPIAQISNGRLDSGEIPGLSIEPNANRGYNWSGDRAYKNLLTVVSDIALKTNLSFDVVGNGAAQFQFKVYENQRGTDHTTVGLDPRTGLNMYGEVPIVFSQEFGNISKASLENDLSNLVNKIFVLGKGQDTDRAYAVRENTDSTSQSPWNSFESTNNANTQDSLQALRDIGDSILEKKQPQKKLAFDTLQLESIAYGKDYTWGDRITVFFDGDTFNKLITGVSISVDKNKIETITARFGDVSEYA